MSPDRSGPLDGLRGVAILLVLAGHIAQNYSPLDETARRWLTAFANAGAGVRLFFVLSGYLITSLLLKELASTGRISLWQFYRRRALRIFPAFYVYLVVLVVLSLWIPLGLTAHTLGAAGTFTWNYAFLWIDPPPGGWWHVGHLWTLALEQQFYLLWPLALVAGGLRRGPWIAVALMLWCPLARVGTYWLFPDQRGYLGSMLHTGVDSLMAGCITAFLVRSAAAQAHLSRHGVAGMVLGGGWLLGLSPLIGELIHGFPSVCGYTLDALAGAWIVACAHLVPGPRLRRWLGRGTLPMIGVISYSLYLWQQLFLSPTGLLATGHVIGPLLGAFAAATLSYFCVERPLLRLAGPSRPTTPCLTTP